MNQLTIIPLGISAGSPTRDRHVSSLAVLLDGHVILFDCGEGTQYQLMRAPFRFGSLEAIFITHLHGDHLYGLPGLLGTLSLQNRVEPLFIYGPPGIRRFMEGIRSSSYLGLTYEIEIEEVQTGVARSGHGYRVEALPLVHRIESIGFCVVENDRPGKFDVEKARALGVPEGPMFRELARGADVVLDDGTTVASRVVVGPSRRGRRIAYCCDTVYCENSIELARGADLMIHEATYGEDCRAEAAPRGHSTASDAARVAMQAGAKQLLLTHFSPRYLDLAVLADEARRIFPATEVATELMAYPVPMPEEESF